MYLIIVKVHSFKDAQIGAQKLLGQLSICKIRMRYLEGKAGCSLLSKECQVDFVDVSSQNAEAHMKGLRPDAIFRFNGGALGKWRVNEFILELGQDDIEPDIFKLIVSQEMEDTFYLYPTDLPIKKQEEMKRFLGDAIFEEKKRQPLLVLCKPKKGASNSK